VLYHGTHEGLLTQIYREGLKCPADFDASKDCPVSKKIFISEDQPTPSVCRSNCKLCVKEHMFSKCHLYGLGIYFSSDPTKSNEDIRSDSGTTDVKVGRKMLLCRVELGYADVLKTFLQSEKEYHDRYLPKEGKDSIFVKGAEKDVKIPTGTSGLPLGSQSDIYVIFHPFQAIPEYVVEFSIA